VEGNTELSNFITLLTLTSNRDLDRIESYLSRLNYGYDNKYFFSGSFRRDGSSRFGPSVRWGNFWSASAGWRIDQEAFLRNVSWLNALKLRTSYGEVGNNALLDDAGNDIYYAYQSFYNLGSNNNNNTEPGAVQATTVANPLLTWEINKQFDAGLEFGLFKNRLSGTIEFFDRKSSNLLFNIPPPVSSGGLSAPKNIGTMYNRGVEISISGDIIKNKNFTWNITTNWTKFKNRITKLPSEKIASSASSTQQWEVGHSRYDFYVRDWYGVDPADGVGLYVMNTYNAANTRVLKNGDSVTTDQANAKMHYAGSAIPDYFGSVINNFSYKGINLFVQLNYQVGGLIFDETYRQLMHTGSYGVASHVDILNRWQKPGDITDVPRLDGGRNAIFNAISDRWLTDASFLNIQNVTLSWMLPTKLTSKMSMQNLKVYLSGENLYMFTKRKGMNPIQNFTGVTSNVYVPSRTITAGITLSL
jgi:TonB-linked SusC/RagA family outer membrane protein